MRRLSGRVLRPSRSRWGDKLRDTQQADPTNTPEIQRLEQKWRLLSHETGQLRLFVDSKRANVLTKEALVRALERQWLSAMDSQSTPERGMRRCRAGSARHTSQTSDKAASTLNCDHLCSLCLSRSLSLSHRQKATKIL